MTAVDGEAPVAASRPARAGPVLDWLLTEGRKLTRSADLLEAACRRLVAGGLPLRRATFHIRILHPQLVGIALTWRADSPGIREFRAPHGIQEQATYLNSPVRLLYEGAEGLRQRLDLAERTYDFPIFDELRAEGFTDYVALPFTFSDGRRHGCSWATDRPGGFTTGELLLIESLLPALGVILEIQVTRQVAVNLLNTYVGPRAGERVLQGQIIRGSGETVRAAIWYCDLRGFTELSERVGRDAVIAILNAYFERMAEPVERHGGEILKFIGDAMLAIFPLDQPEAGCRALTAAGEAYDAMAALNAERRERGEEPLGYGLALHVGDVMYGNIGAPDRLDFTVIGPAVNLASRMERLSRVLGAAVLLSDEFARLCGRGAADLASLGPHRLRGIPRPVEIFALPKALSAAAVAAGGGRG